MLDIQLNQIYNQLKHGCDIPNIFCKYVNFAVVISQQIFLTSCKNVHSVVVSCSSTFSGSFTTSVDWSVDSIDSGARSSDPEVIQWAMSADASSFRPRANSWSQINWSSKPGVDVSDPRTGYSLFGPHLGIVPTIFDSCNSSNLAFKFSSIASFSLKVAFSCNSWFSSFSIEMPKQFKP